MPRYTPRPRLWCGTTGHCDTVLEDIMTTKSVVPAPQSTIIRPRSRLISSPAPIADSSGSASSRDSSIPASTTALDNALRSAEVESVGMPTMTRARRIRRRDTADLTAILSNLLAAATSTRTPFRNGKAVRSGLTARPIIRFASWPTANSLAVMSCPPSKQHTDGWSNTTSPDLSTTREFAVPRLIATSAFRKGHVGERSNISAFDLEEQALCLGRTAPSSYQLSSWSPGRFAVRLTLPSRRAHLNDIIVGGRCPWFATSASKGE